MLLCNSFHSHKSLLLEKLLFSEQLRWFKKEIMSYEDFNPLFPDFLCSRCLGGLCVFSFSAQLMISSSQNEWIKRVMHFNRQDTQRRWLMCGKWLQRKQVDTQKMVADINSWVYFHLLSSISFVLLFLSFFYFHRFGNGFVLLSCKLVLVKKLSWYIGLTQNVYFH